MSVSLRLLLPSILVDSIYVIEGGSADPETNHALAAVIKKAKSQGVPRDNLEKALKKVDAHLMAE